MGEEEAEREAIRTLGLDDDFCPAMSAVHWSAVARALDLMPRAVSLGIERTTA
jgi:hypothetical protein